MRRWLIVVGIGVVGALAVVRLVLAGAPSAGPGDVAVDTTGASAAEATSSVSTPTTDATTEPLAAELTSLVPNAAAATPVPTPAQPTPTPVVLQLQGTNISTVRKPLLLLNPSAVREGSTIGVTGSGFAAGITVDLIVKQKADDKGTPITFVQVDKSGGFGGVSFAVPDGVPHGTFIIVAKQRKDNDDGDELARATAIVAGGAPEVKLGTQVGKPGDTVELSAGGFGPNEDVRVYWNGISSTPTGVLHTDQSGALRQGSIRVPFGAVGDNGFIFVGENSQSPVTVPFQLLNLYPSVELSSYAIKPDNLMTFTGKDFGPGEQVMAYLNSPEAQPLARIQADAEGGFSNAGGFVVPFGLRGKQTVIFIGEESKAPTTASFDTLPYTPSVQPSTYGGRPGTTMAFYATGFARGEVVHTFLARTDTSQGKEVTCFMTDQKGNAAAAGSYVVPGDAPPGQMVFTLVGSKSQATATTALDVVASDVPVQTPPQADFTCPLDDDAPGE